MTIRQRDKTHILDPFFTRDIAGYLALNASHESAGFGRFALACVYGVWNGGGSQRNAACAQTVARWRGLGGEMMTKDWSRSLCALFAMIGASTSARAQNAKVITYDEWSAIESAKRSCERALAWHKEKKGLIAQLGCDSIPSCNEMMPTVMACTMTSGAQGSQQFEGKMVSEFFKNPSCKGITWAGHQDPTEAAKVSVAEAILKPHWALSARLNLGNEKQYWQVIHNKTGTYAEGTDSPSGIVEKLCTLINGP